MKMGKLTYTVTLKTIIRKISVMLKFENYAFSTLIKNGDISNDLNYLKKLDYLKCYISDDPVGSNKTVCFKTLKKH